MLELKCTVAQEVYKAKSSRIAHFSQAENIVLLSVLQITRTILCS